VNKNMASHYRNPTAFRSDQDAISRREKFERETALALGPALIIIVLSSLGFWWAILWAVWPLVSACWNR
jgi:hypothetical protein